MNRIVLAAALAGALVPSGAWSAATIDLNQVGNDVVVTVGGSLDLSLLTAATSGGSFTSGVRGTPAYISGGNSFGSLSNSYTATGPGSFGNGTVLVSPSSGAGTGFLSIGAVANTASSAVLTVNQEYVSGTTFVATSTYLGQSIASLGLTAGQYVYTAGRETVTVNIGAGGTGAVPEAATWATMLAGFGAIGATLRRRRATRFA